MFFFSSSPTLKSLKKKKVLAVLSKDKIYLYPLRLLRSTSTTNPPNCLESPEVHLCHAGCSPWAPPPSECQDVVELPLLKDRCEGADRRSGGPAGR